MQVCPTAQVLAGCRFVTRTELRMFPRSIDTLYDFEKQRLGMDKDNTPNHLQKVENQSTTGRLGIPRML